MNIYKKMYYLLFNAMSDACQSIEEQNYGKAKDILRNAQLKAEELYLEQEDGVDSF